jgi:ectoine hydroxylase-related dioxygenase (phytanoyl-CoA dioxygenase family)
MPGEAGDAIFFHIHTVHGSTPNRSDAPRASFINRYLAADDYQLVFATSVQMRQEAEARARADELAVKCAKTHGFMVRGRRSYDPDFNYNADSGVHH